MRVLSLMVKAKIKLINVPIRFKLCIFTSFDSLLYSSHPILFFSLLHFSSLSMGKGLQRWRTTNLYNDQHQCNQFTLKPRLLYDVFGHIQGRVERMYTLYTPRIDSTKLLLKMKYKQRKLNLGYMISRVAFQNTTSHVKGQNQICRDFN